MDVLKISDSSTNSILEPEKENSDFFPLFDSLFYQENNLDKCLIFPYKELKENINRNNLGKKFLRINKSKRGRKTFSENQKRVHGNNTFDNIERKIQVHFLTFLINFSNDALKTEYKYSNYSFKQINYKDKTTINQVYTSFLKRSSIKDILKFEISDKYKRYNKNSNKELLEKVISSSTWLSNLFELKYLKLFNYYYNKEEPLKKIIFENKEIILSPKTKSFYELLEKNKNNELREEIIKAVKSIYFNGCDSNNNHFSTIIFSCS